MEVVEGWEVSGSVRGARKSQEVAWKCHFSGSLKNGKRHREKGDAWRLKWYKHRQGEEKYNVCPGSVNGPC